MCRFCSEIPCVCREYALEAVRNVVEGARTEDLERFNRGTETHKRLWKRFTPTEWGEIWDAARGR